MKSWLLVALQTLCLGAILLTGAWWAARPVARIAESAGVLLGLWAAWSMRRSKLRILPDVAAGARLVTAGPYRWIRHPMYSAVLLAFGALVLDRAGVLRVLAWVVLAGVLWVKLVWEEKLLAQRFPEYKAYQEKTKRLVPFVI